MVNKKRKCLMDLSELLDNLTINQIKEVKLAKYHRSYSEEMRNIMADLELIIKKKRVKLTARLIRLLVVLSQINLHIWQAKEIMINEPSRFKESMKLGHQLNGIRNQVKNLIIEEVSSGDSVRKKTNINTDNLKGWQISL